MASPPPQTPITIRPALHQDVGDLTDLLARSFHHPGGWFGWLYPLLRAGIYEDLSHRLRHPSDHYACLTAVDSAAVGSAALHGERRDFPQRSPVSPTPSALCTVETITRLLNGDRPRLPGSPPLIGTVEIAAKSPFPFGWGDPTYLYVSNLAIDDDYRRQGIATALLEACDQLARRWGFSMIYLDVLEDNRGARQLYRRAGYETEGVRGSWLGYLLGRSRRLLMRKRINGRN